MSYKVEPDLKYLPEHDWAKIDGDIVLIGVTDYAQKALKDVVYVELPEVGANFRFKEVFGTIESVKAASELFSPVAGEVIEVNIRINDEPEKVNSDPYGSWLIKVKPLDLEADWEKLMTPEEYANHCSEED
ncbi:MAG: glycine cleavage system protein GcvH [Candidatus Hodarchaeota archaeon]